MVTAQQDAIYSKLKMSFNKKDHWHFETSQFEKDRFATMLHFCSVVPNSRILEIGCAEGHFTEMLCQISDNVTATDLSEIALKRAKTRAPHAKYEKILLEDMKVPAHRYDIIVCSEVLYYLTHQKNALKKLQSLGRFLVTSNFLMNNWGGYIAEYYLQKFPLISRKTLISIHERKASIISLRSLER